MPGILPGMDGVGSGAANHSVGSEFLYTLRRHFHPRPHIDAEISQLLLIPGGQCADILFKCVASGVIKSASEFIGPLRQSDAVAAHSGCPSSLHTACSASYYESLFFLTAALRRILTRTPPTGFTAHVAETLENDDDIQLPHAIHG